METLKFFLILTLIFNFSQNSKAQFCGFDEDMDSFKSQQPSNYYTSKSAHAAAVDYYRKYHPGVNYIPEPEPCENCLQMDSTCPIANYLLPIVVHVVHLPSDSVGQGSNISEAQILHQIELLNMFFRNHYGANSINTGIQFCLAKMNPDGSPIDGINRIASDSSNMHRNNQNELLNLVHYPTNQYINIYVINGMLDINNNPINIAGFASYPYKGSRAKDLIVIRSDWFGDYTIFNTLNSQSRGKTLVHEMGHYLGLFHPFEDACVGDDSSDCSTKGDLCCDVPPVAAGIPGNCGPSNTCTETPNDLADQKENHMDYALETCRTRFTPDQGDIMYAVLDGVRSSLWQPENINNLNLACCVNAIAFGGQTDVCKNSGDSIHVSAYRYDSAIYVWKLYKNNGLYQSINMGNTHTLALLPDTGLYDMELEVTRNGVTSSKHIDKAFEIIYCDSLFPSTQGSWYFGQYAGIKFYKNGLVLRDVGPFNNQKPIQINASEGTLSICDSLGNLLFYGGVDDKYFSQNLRIFDKNYKQVENSPIVGNHTASQGNILCKVPFSSNRYYIFHTPLIPDNGKSLLRYSIFDLSKTTTTHGEITLNSEEVKDGNLESITSSHEGITLVPGCNDSINWVIFPSSKNGHPSDSQYLTVIKVTKDSVVWYSDIHLSIVQNYQNTLKASPNGKYLSYGQYLLEFDRSDAKIIVNNYDSSNTLINVIGCSFSPNSKYLYKIEGHFDRLLPFNDQNYYTLTQTDVTRTNSFQYKKVVKSIDYHEQMQIGPDKKIYVTALNQTYISAIEYPDTLFMNSNNIGFKEEAAILSKNGVGGICNLGFPNHVDALKREKIKTDFDFRINNCNTVEFLTNQCCATNYKWYFFDTLGSTNKYPEPVIFNENGQYTIKLIADNDTVIRTIYIGIDSNQLTLNGPISVCDSVIPKIYNGLYNADFSYNWQVTNGSLVATDLNQSEIIWKSNGTVKLNIIDNRTQCQDSVQKSITFYEPTILNDSIFDSQSSCSILSIDTLRGTNYSGEVNYLWLNKINNQTWQPISNSNMSNYKPTIIDTTIAYYRIAINNANCTNITSNTIVITKGDSLSDTILQDQYLCKNAKMDTIFGSLHDNVSYNWFTKKAGQSDWTIDSNATSAFYFKPNIDTTFYIKRIAINSIGCDYFSNSIKVTYEKPVNTISPKYPASPYCYYGADGSDPAIGSVEIKYKWLVSNQINNNYNFSPYTFNQRDTLKNLAFEIRPDRKCKIYRIVQYNDCFDTSAIKELFIEHITKHPDDVNKCFSQDSFNNNQYINVDLATNSPGSSERLIWQKKPKLGSTWQILQDAYINSYQYKYMLDSNIQGDTARFSWIISQGGCYDTLISNNAIIKTDFTKPHITSIFTNITADQFVTLNYVVTASNSSNANYYWQVKAAGTNFWAPLNNNSATLELSPVEFCQNGNTYRVIVSNACGSDTSNNSILTVNQFIYTLLHDIWMKDNTKDTAAEPNTFVDPSNITLDVYRSPDIWNCKDNSSCLNHENAEFKTSSPNYAQVKVRNKGPYQTNHDNLRVYWTHCSTGEIWDESWIGTNKNRFWNADSAKYFPLGGEITGINGSLISNLDANDSVIISLPWYPPNPKWYYSYDSGSKVYEKSSCICLLARIEQCNKYPFGMTSPERFGLKIQDNVIKNNNIITKNIAVLDEINGNFKVKSEWTGVGRVMNDCDSFEILLKPEYSSFFDDWIVEVILDDTISKLWFAGGEQGSGFSILDSNRLLVDENEQFSIKNICLKKDQLAFVAVEFTAKDTTNNIPVKAYDVALWQQDLNNGPDSYQGGFIYRIENSDNQLNNNYTSYKRKPNFKDKTETLPSIWNVFPNPARNQISVAFNSNFEGQANIELVDVFGKKIYLSKIDIVKGEQLTILNTDYLANGTYFIRLYTPEIVGTRKVVILKE